MKPSIYHVRSTRAAANCLGGAHDLLSDGRTGPSAWALEAGIRWMQRCIASESNLGEAERSPANSIANLQSILDHAMESQRYLQSGQADDARTACRLAWRLAKIAAQMAEGIVPAAEIAFLEDCDQRPGDDR